MKLKNNLTVESQMQKYIAKGFYSGQLEQIQQGLEDNIDVSKFASFRYNTGVICLLRELMTFDDEFDIDNYTKDYKLEIERLFSRHDEIVHLHSNMTSFNDAPRQHIIMWGPYYTVDKNSRIKKTF